MRITKSVQTTIKVVWICLLVIATPFIIYFGFWGIIGFLFSSWGGNEMDGTFLLITIIPTTALAYATYLLFKWLHGLEKQEIHASTQEASPQPTTIEEQQVVNTLSQNGGLTLSQMTSITGIETDRLMSMLKNLMTKGMVTQKIEAGLAVFFLTRHP